MLQISQYLDIKYFEIIPLLLCIISLITFIKLIINYFKKNDLTNNVIKLIELAKNKLIKKPENQEDAESPVNQTNETKTTQNKLEESPTTAAITKRLEGEKTSFLSNSKIFSKIFSKINIQKLKENIQKIIDFTSTKIIPILFLSFLFIWTLFNFIPAPLNRFFPADSEQTLTIKNDSGEKQFIALLGRIHNSNNWKPIMPYSPSIQGNYLMKLNTNESLRVKLRTGKNDIDYLIIANLSSKNIRGITLSVPRNEVVAYTNQMNKLANKLNIFLFSILLNICLYFTAVICCIWFFLNEFSKLKNKKASNLIILSSSCGILVIAFAIIFWWNLRAFLYLY